MIQFVEDQIIQSFASCTLSDEEISNLLTAIEPKHFSLPELSFQYEGLTKLYSEGNLNAYSVRKIINGYEVPENILYDSQILQAVKDVKNAYKLRKISETIRNVHNRYLSNPEPNLSAETVLSEIERSVYEIQIDQETKTVEYSKAIQEETSRFFSASPSKIQGVHTGDKDLDSILNGYQAKEYYIIGARPSMGKTAFGLFNIIEMALKGHKVGFFSLEMSAEKIMMRIFSYLVNKDSNTIQVGGFFDKSISKFRAYSDEEKQHIISEVIDKGNLQIYINDQSGLSIEKMQTIAKLWKSKHDIDCILIDYVQYISSDRRFDNMTNQIGYISKNLKAMAKNLNIPVVALAQLSRANEKRTNKEPMLSDLRDSGNIEQDADCVMFLHRPDYYEPSLEQKIEPISDLKVIVAKNRNGKTGAFTKKYNLATGRMYELQNETIPKTYVTNVRNGIESYEHDPNDRPF